jgi:translation initiation factor 2 subunit 3
MNLDYDTFIKQTMQSQSLINVGMIGHVDNGKSSVTKALSGKTTQEHSAEQKQNITIKLGYANAKIWKCPNCTKPECYQPTPSADTEHNCVHCHEQTDLVNHISFADCPGHHDLMQVMLNGTCIMDYALLIESAINKQIPALQTIEHFEIAQESGIKTAIICMNKMDLMLKNKSLVKDNINRLDEFVKSCGATKKIPIVPVSATMGYNIDIVCEYIANMTIPQKDLSDKYKMLIIRSFNINKERIPIQNLKGGVIGGSLVRGMIKINDDVVIYPGYIKKENDVWYYTPLQSKALSINSDKTELEYAVAGGLIGVQLDIDSAFTGNDHLVGQVLYNKTEENVKVFSEITLKYKRLTQKLTEYISGGANEKRFNIGDAIQINVNSNNIHAQLKDYSNQHMELILEKPVCSEIGDSVSISKLFDRTRIDICGQGILESGVECQLCQN